MQYGRDIDQNVKNRTFQSLCESHCIIVHEYSTGYSERGMCREANRALGGAECPRDTFRVHYIR